MKISKIIGITIIIIVIAIPIYRNHELQKMEDYSRQSMEYLSAKNYAKAIEMQQKIIDAHPEVGAGQLGMSLVYLVQKDYENAKKYCDLALVANPKLKTEKAYEFCNTIPK